MKQLKAKLYELEMQKRNDDQQAVEETKSDIGWGSHIRSYVLDLSRIKDLRTNIETGNTQAVLDGDIDQFIEASLKSGLWRTKHATEDTEYTEVKSVFYYKQKFISVFSVTSVAIINKVNLNYDWRN